MEQSGFELFCVIFVYNPECDLYTVTYTLRFWNNDLD
jgi:hypothetical protein